VNFIKNQLGKAIGLFKSDSLFRNAVFLMSSTAIMSALGFGFWFFVAHLYTPADIGVASALISITLLASNLSFFGLNSGILRFLSTSKTRSQDINASLIIVSVASMLAAAAYLLWIGDDFTGKLGAFTSTPYGQILFVLLMAVVSLNTFTDSVFIASRRAEFHTIVYAVFGVVKLVLPLFLISRGSLGIFGAYVMAAAASLVLSLYLMWRYCGYHPFSRPNWHFIAKSREYASNNYVASLLSGLPSQLMPSLVIRGLGAADAAFFAMAWTMANLLYVIPSAITNSLMAETSHDTSRQAQNVRRAVGILALTVTPAVILAIIVAPALLTLFGHQYSTNGTLIFQLLAFATFFMGANSVGNAIMNIEKRSGGVVLVQAIIATATLGLVLPLMRFGLVGVGLAFIIGSFAGNIVQLALLAAKRPQADAAARRAAPLSPPSWDVVKQLVASYALLGAKVGRDIGWGDRSSTVVISAASRKYVIKVYDTRMRSRSQLQEELAFTRFLHSRGVPVPEIITTTGGETTAQFTSAGETWVAVLMSFAPGSHPETYSPKLIADMARVQGLIHEAGLEFAGRRNSATPSQKKQTLRSSLLPNVPKGVSHFDYDGSNILVEGDKVSCVVDFEGMRFDPLVACIFFSLTRLYDIQHQKRSLETYLRSYQAVRRLNWLEKPVLNIVLALRHRTPKLLLLHY